MNDWKSCVNAILEKTKTNLPSNEPTLLPRTFKMLFTQNLNVEQAVSQKENCANCLAQFTGLRRDVEQMFKSLEIEFETRVAYLTTINAQARESCLADVDVRLKKFGSLRNSEDLKQEVDQLKEQVLSLTKQVRDYEAKLSKQEYEARTALQELQAAKKEAEVTKEKVDRDKLSQQDEMRAKMDEIQNQLFVQLEKQQIETQEQQELEWKQAKDDIAFGIEKELHKKLTDHLIPTVVHQQVQQMEKQLSHSLEETLNESIYDSLRRTLSLTLQELIQDKILSISHTLQEETQEKISILTRSLKTDMDAKMSALTLSSQKLIGDKISNSMESAQKVIAQQLYDLLDRRFTKSIETQISELFQQISNTTQAQVIEKVHQKIKEDTSSILIELSSKVSQNIQEKVMSDVQLELETLRISLTEQTDTQQKHASKKSELIIAGFQTNLSESLVKSEKENETKLQLFKQELNDKWAQFSNRTHQMILEEQKTTQQKLHVIQAQHKDKFDIIERRVQELLEDMVTNISVFNLPLNKHKDVIILQSQLDQLKNQFTNEIEPLCSRIREDMLSEIQQFLIKQEIMLQTGVSSGDLRHSLVKTEEQESSSKYSVDRLQHVITSAEESKEDGKHKRNPPLPRDPINPEKIEDCAQEITVPEEKIIHYGDDFDEPIDLSQHDHMSLYELVEPSPDKTQHTVNLAKEEIPKDSSFEFD